MNLKYSAHIFEQILTPEFQEKGKRLNGKIDANTMICQLDKIILNEDKEKRIRIENSAPIWWRFGVGQENPNHKNILTKWELSEISLFHDN